MIFEPDNQPERPQQVDAYQTADFPADCLERMDQVCLLFESKWKSGISPDIESHLEGFDDDLRSALFAELLLLDIEYRTRAGETPAQADYETRFPSETPAIESAFRSNGDACHVLSDRLPPLQDLSLTSKYQLRQFHARGGLGVIYVAYDENLGRNVAVKFARRRNADSATQARLAREAEITGRLEHPGIVPVYATGMQQDGSPCYVMQLIKGQTLRMAISEFHDEPQGGHDDRFTSLKFRQLLQRLIAVCYTVAYAHDQQVIHRDIKPSNIMLGKFGETFLLDWGLAKSLIVNDPATERNSDAKSAADKHVSDLPQTETGQQIGTPAFASPEQAMGKVQDHDIRTDVFALGATLYCLLVGKGPVDANSMQPAELLRSYHNIAKPRSIDKTIPRNLETVCWKAIAFDPAQRYDSSVGLANDLERYLADEPIAAVSEPVTAQVRRWIRKNPWKVVAVASSLLIALFSLAIGSWLLGQKNLELSDTNSRLVESRKLERRARTNTKKALDSLTDNAIERWLATSEQISPADKQFLKLILNQYQSFADDNPDDIEGAEIKAEGYHRVAKLLDILSNRDEAIATCLSSLEFIENLDMQASDKLLQIKSTIQSLASSILSQNGNQDRARSLALAAVDTARDLTEGNPESELMVFNYSQQLENLGTFHLRNYEYQDAVIKFRNSLEILEKIPEKQHDRNAWLTQHAAAYHGLGLSLEKIGQKQDAVKCLISSLNSNDRIISPNSGIKERIDHCRIRATLAAIHLSLKQYDDAEANLDKALPQAEKISADYPMLTQPLRDIGNIWFQKAGIRFNKKKYKSSIEQSEKAIRTFETLLTRLPDDLMCMNCLSNTHGLQAGSYSVLKDHETAIDHCMHALDYAEKLYAAHPSAYRHELVTRLWFACKIHLKQNKYAEIREFAERALTLIEEFKNPAVRSKYWRKEIGLHQMLGWSLMHLNQHEQAVIHWQAIIDETEQKPIFRFDGENMHVTARIERAACEAVFQPDKAVADIREIEKRDDLMAVQVYEMSRAAAAASQNISAVSPRSMAEELALQLLQTAAEDNYFSSASKFNKLVRQDDKYSSLIEQEEFLRIEQSIRKSFD